MKCHEVDYEIYGDDLQYVEIELDPGETVVAEAGAMLTMEEDITYEAKMGDGSSANESMINKIFSAGKRVVSGESLFMTHFTNTGQGKRRVSFASSLPGKVIALDMATLSTDLICQKDSFLCAALGTTLSITLNKRMGAGFFGGEGFILERISGDGIVCVNAGGTVIEKQLDGETLRVDTGCIVGFEESIDYSIQKAGNLKSMLFGGEGLFLATLQGTGTVWLQSLPFSKLADNIIAHAPKTGGKDRGQGSLLGNIANFMEQ